MPVTASDLLAPDGPIARRMCDAHGFEPRPQQVAMAEAVSRALAWRDGIDGWEDEEEYGGERVARPGARLLVEAGTGVGKSFAYLVPAILRCLLHRERVVVATNTIALQEQLINKDIPFLQETIPQWGLPEVDAKGERLPELRAVLVKGRGNYISVRRLELASKRALTLLPDAASRESLRQIEEWAYTTTDGTLSTLPPIERMGVWDRVQSDSGNCMGRKCPYYQKCFYQNARRRMEAGNLLVCNHALFFSDLALRAASGGEAAILPAYDHVILDEAHNIEDAASEHFGVSLTESRVSHLLGLLYHHRTGRGYLANVKVKGDVEPLDAAHRAVLAAEDASRAFFDGLRELAQRGGLPAGRIPPERAGEIANPLTPAMRTLAMRLKVLREVIAEEADGFELNSYVMRAQAIGEAAEALVTQSVPGSVYWIESSEEEADLFSGGRRHGAKVRLACSPVEVAPLLAEHLFSKAHSVVLTSATLATRAVAAGEPKERAEMAFAHVMSRLGIDPAGDGGTGEVATLQLDSPFDYARQVRVYADVTMPDPRGGAEGGAYIDALCSRIVDHVTATDGGAFVLFTSFATLYRCADLLEGPLGEMGMPLLVQGRGGSRSHILERFREDERSVLLGAASFWQGVDVRGRALRNVIITRLPFDPPDRPLTQARLEKIKERGGNPFMEDSVPRAVIRFKQGFGRLIRSREDRGRVVVLDPRIVTARYGRLFLEALPGGVELDIVEA